MQQSSVCKKQKEKYCKDYKYTKHLDGNRTMYLNDLNSASHSVEKINRVLSQTFGHSVDLSEMSTDALSRMLTATNSKISQIKESDLAYWENPQYNKLNLIQHQLRTYISEVAPGRTDGKPMKRKVKESTDLESAEVLLAAQELVDKLQKMVEDLASMQVQELMPIVDAMKEQVGFDTAEAYNSAAEGALAGLLDQAKAAKEALENATLAARGEAPATPAPTDLGAVGDDFDGGDLDMSADADIADDFGGDDAAAGAENPVGRELKAESALNRMEKKAIAEARVLAAKKKVLEAAKASGYNKAQLQKLLKSI